MDNNYGNEVLQRLTRVETKLDMQLNAKDIAVNALNLGQQCESRLNKQEDNQRWLWRTLFGTLIATTASIAVMLIKWKAGG